MNECRKFANHTTVKDVDTSVLLNEDSYNILKATNKHCFNITLPEYGSEDHLRFVNIHILEKVNHFDSTGEKFIGTNIHSFKSISENLLSQEAKGNAPIYDRETQNVLVGVRKLYLDELNRLDRRSDMEKDLAKHRLTELFHKSQNETLYTSDLDMNKEYEKYFSYPAFTYKRIDENGNLVKMDNIDIKIFKNEASTSNIGASTSNNGASTSKVELSSNEYENILKNEQVDSSWMEGMRGKFKDGLGVLTNPKGNKESVVKQDVILAEINKKPFDIVETPAINLPVTKNKAEVIVEHAKVKVDETKSNKNEQLQIENSKAESSNINELNVNKITGKVEPLPAKLETEKTITYINKQGETVTETINVVDKNKSFLGGLFSGLKSLKKVDDNLKSHVDEPKIKGIVSEKMAETKTVVEGGAENIEAPKYFTHPDHSKLKPQMSGVDDNIVVDRLEKMRKHISTSPVNDSHNSSVWPTPSQNNNQVLPSVEQVVDTQNQNLLEQVVDTKNQNLVEQVVSGTPLTRETLPLVSASVQDRVMSINKQSKGKERELLNESSIDDTPLIHKPYKMIIVDKELFSQNTGSTSKEVELPVSNKIGENLDNHSLIKIKNSGQQKLLTREKITDKFKNMEDIIKNENNTNLLVKTLDPSSVNVDGLNKSHFIVGMELINDFNYDINLKRYFKHSCLDKHVDGINVANNSLDYRIHYNSKKDEFGIISHDGRKIFYQDDYKYYVKCVNHINNYEMIPEEMKKGKLSLEKLMSALSRDNSDIHNIKPSDLRIKSNQINSLEDLNE